MDNLLNFQRYHRLIITSSDEDNLKCRRKVLLTRTFKLSAMDNQYAFTEIGRISFDSGQTQKSLLQIKRALIIDPSYSYAQLSLAKALLKLGKENEAFSELKSTLCTSPRYSAVHRLVIDTFLEGERLEEIDSFYQEIVEGLSDTRSIAILYYTSAEALVRLNEYSKGLEMYKKAFETDQMDSSSHFEYAMALYHEGFFEEAIVQFEHVKRLDPTNNIAFNNVAHLQYCLGRLQKAFEEYEHIIANGLESTATYSNFILVLHHLDKDEEVIHHSRDLLQQNLGDNGSTLKAMYGEALRITQAKLERDRIDEETREFYEKKIKGISLVLSFLN